MVLVLLSGHSCFVFLACLLDKLTIIKLSIHLSKLFEHYY